MKKLLAIVVLGLLSNNIVSADETLSILGIKLLDNIENYNIKEDHGVDDMSKSKRTYSVYAKTKNEYFDDVLLVDTFGEEKIIYNIRTFNSKKKETDALQCQNVILSILNKKTQDFNERGYRRTIIKNNDGSFDSRNNYFKKIEATFINDNSNYTFRMISACDTSGKQGMSAKANIWLILRDKKLSDKVVAEWKNSLNKEAIEEEKKRIKGF